MFYEHVFYNFCSAFTGLLASVCMRSHEAYVVGEIFSVFSRRSACENDVREDLALKKGC